VYFILDNENSAGSLRGQAMGLCENISIFFQNQSYSFNASAHAHLICVIKSDHLINE
jgi:hypothetical protein